MSLSAKATSYELTCSAAVGIVEAVDVKAGTVRICGANGVQTFTKASLTEYPRHVRLPVRNKLVGERDA